MGRGKYVSSLLALVLGAVLVTASCQTTYPIPPGDYLIHVRTKADLQKEYSGTSEIYGFWRPGTDPCEIWVRVDRMGTSTLPHEAKHCTDGFFHK